MLFSRIRFFDLHTILPVVNALCFAAYGVLTRHAARRDSVETSFFWTGVGGAIGVSLIGPFFWLPPASLRLALDGGSLPDRVCGHFLLIMAYDVTEASTVQPFAYFQLVFASAVGMWAFGDVIDRYIVLGASIIVEAGLFIFWRERQLR